MTIAITGANGQLGRLVVEHLKTRGAREDIVTLVRDPTRAADLGVASRAFDYDAQGLAETLLDIDVLLLISGDEMGRRVSQHRNVIAAAKDAGVKRIAYTSILHGDRSPLSMADDHKATEAMLRASGLGYTLLRNGWYLENYAGPIAAALAGGGFIGSAGMGRISAAARADYAAAAALVLTQDGHDGKTYELAGDTAFTMAELAAEVSRQSGRSLTYTDLLQADYARALEGFGLPSPFAAILAQSDSGAARGGLFEDGRQLSALIGRPTASLASFVSQVLA